MNILITGANGQLGSEIKALSSAYPQFHFTYADLPELDITDKIAVQNIIGKNSIDGIINCAAYTAVDKAESDAVIAEKVNALAVKNLVDVSEDNGIKLLHISTDYVFDGTKHTPYNVDDPVAPIGVYGITKRKGEEYILNSMTDSVIIRTSWLYSAYGNNFVKTMLRLGNERDELGVIFDQVGTPTYARDLAKACLEIMATLERWNAKGKVYHFSNEGVASWFDFAKTIMELGERNCQVNPIETKDYPTPAQRPHYSVLNKAAIKADFGIKIPYWRDSLKECIKEIAKQQ